MQKNKPTYQDVLDDIEMIRLAIKLCDDTDERKNLENELLYAENYLEHITDKGRA